MTAGSTGTTLAYSNDLHLNSPWYRKPWFLAMAVGTTMLVVVASIFTVSSLARDVSRLAQASHSTNEVLRVASVVQTEFVTADGFRNLGSEFNTTAVVDSSVGVAATGLTSLREALEEPSLPAAITQELEDYVDIAELHLADPTGEVTMETVAGSFDRLSTSLLAERSASQEDLEFANSRMNSVAAIAGFAIAFLVPAAGLYVWEALRRTRGRQRVLEREIARLRTESQAVSGQLETTVSGLKHQSVKLVTTVSSASQAAALEESQELAKTVDQLRRVAVAGNPLETIVRQPTRLVDVVRQVVNTAMVPTLSLPSRSQLSPEIVVVIDADKMQSALTDLVHMAARTGGAMSLNVVRQDTAAVVQLRHDGTPVDPSILQSVPERDRDVSNIRHQIETAGGSLSLEAGPEASTYSVIMPLAIDERSASPGPRQSEHRPQ